MNFFIRILFLIILTITDGFSTSRVIYHQELLPIKSTSYFKSKILFEKYNNIRNKIVNPYYLPKNPSFFPTSSQKRSYSTESESNNLKTKRILSIDGGGIRGIIPAQILSKIEAEILNKNKDNKNYIANAFDLIVGASAGGIITLALNVPDSKNVKKPKFEASKLVELYENEGKRIFPQKDYSIIKHLFFPKYSAEPLEKLLDNYFGDCKISDSISKVLVTNYNMAKDDHTNRAIPLDFFRSWSKLDDQGNFLELDKKNNYYMKDVARATSAAPTYFYPAEIKDFDGAESHHIDGGIVCNNPTVAALFTAINIFPDAESYKILSLGTGEAPKENQKKSGIISWVWKSEIITLMMNASSQLVDSQMVELEKMLKNKKINVDYVRIQPQIKSEEMKLDNIKSLNIKNLKEYANKEYINNKYRIEKILEDF